MEQPCEREAPYELVPGWLPTSRGEFPVVNVFAADPDSALHHLRDECGWPSYDLSVLPAADPRWQVLIDRASMTPVAVIRADAKGHPEILLWEPTAGAEADPVSAQWAALADASDGLAVLMGPIPDLNDPTLLRGAAATGRLCAVTALVVWTPLAPSADHSRRHDHGAASRPTRSSASRLPGGGTARASFRGRGGSATHAIPQVWS